jgi:hypothetical protein
MNPQELKNKIRILAKKVYSDRMITPKEAIVFDELTKFPELKSVLVDLLTPDYDKFISSIDWVAPRPTTFRINLKNEQDFYLMYGKRSWIAQVEGRKYYLKNLPEEEKAALAISRLLRFGIKDDEEVDRDMEGDDFDAPTKTPPADTPAEESPTED